MSPFKEPQPRKKVAGAEEPMINQWPPYLRQGGEVNYTEPKPVTSVHTVEELAAAQTPIMVIPDHTQFELRKAALEAALTHARNLNLDNTAQGVTGFADIFENYLRNGKPS